MSEEEHQEAMPEPEEAPAPEAIAPVEEPEPVEAEAQPNLAQPPVPVSPTHPSRDPSEDEDPTYLVEPWAGLTHYVCLLDNHEDWSLETFTQHMQVYHRGIMRVQPPGPGPGPEDTTPETVDAPEAAAGQAPETATTDPEASAEAPAPEGA